MWTIFIFNFDARLMAYYCKVSLSKMVQSNFIEMTWFLVNLIIMRHNVKMVIFTKVGLFLDCSCTIFSWLKCIVITNILSTLSVEEIFVMTINLSQLRSKNQRTLDKIWSTHINVQCSRQRLAVKSSAFYCPRPKRPDKVFFCICQLYNVHKHNFGTYI